MLDYFTLFMYDKNNSFCFYIHRMLLHFKAHNNIVESETFHGKRARFFLPGKLIPDINSFSGSSEILFGLTISSFLFSEPANVKHIYITINYNV